MATAAETGRQMPPGHSSFHVAPLRGCRPPQLRAGAIDQVTAKTIGPSTKSPWVLTHKTWTSGRHQSQFGTSVHAYENGQEAREIHERKDLWPRIEAHRHQGQCGEPAKHGRPARPLGRAGRHCDQECGAARGGCHEDHPGDARQWRTPLPGHLKPPVEVDPDAVRRGKAEDVTDSGTRPCSRIHWPDRRCHQMSGSNSS